MPEYYFERTNRSFIANRRVDNGYSHDMHIHDGYEVYILNKGQIRFEFETFAFDMKHGMAVVIPAYVPHRSYCDSNCVYDRMIISMQKDFITELSTDTTDLFECFEEQEDCSGYVMTLSDNQIADVMRLVERINDVAKNDMFGDDILYKNYASELLVIFNRAMKHNESTAVNTMPEIVHQIFTYIRYHWRDDFSFDELAAETHFSSAYLSRKFKEYTGVTIQQCLIRKRVESACGYLRLGESVTTACYGSGFNDYSNFIRTFGKVMGMTPGEYAKKNR